MRDVKENREKMAAENLGREARERWDYRLGPRVCPLGFRAAIFCVTHDGLSERGTTRSLFLP